MEQAAAGLRPGACGGEAGRDWASLMRARIKASPLAQEEKDALEPLVRNPRSSFRIKGWSVTRSSVAKSPQRALALLETEVPRWHEEITGEHWLTDLARSLREVQSLPSPLREVLLPAVLDRRATLRHAGNPVVPEWMQEHPGEARACLENEAFCGQHRQLTGDGWLEEAGWRWRRAAAAGVFREWLWHWACTGETRLATEGTGELDVETLTPRILEGPLPKVWLDLTGAPWLHSCAVRWKEAESAGPRRAWLWRWACTGEPTLEDADGTRIRLEEQSLDLLEGAFPGFWARVSGDASLQDAAARLRRADGVGLGKDWLTHWVRTGRLQLRDSAGTPVTRATLRSARLAMQPILVLKVLEGRLPAFWSEVMGKPWLQEIADRWGRARAAGSFQRWTWYWACTGNAELRDYTGAGLSVDQFTDVMIQSDLPRVWRDLTGDGSLLEVHQRWTRATESVPSQRVWWRHWAITGRPVLVGASGEPLAADRLGHLTVDLLESSLPEFWMIQTGQPWLKEIADRWALTSAAGSHRDWFWHWACTGEPVLRRPDGQVFDRGNRGHGRLPGDVLRLWGRLVGNPKDGGDPGRTGSRDGDASRWTGLAAGALWTRVLEMRNAFEIRVRSRFHIVVPRETWPAVVLWGSSCLTLFLGILMMKPMAMSPLRAPTGAVNAGGAGPSMSGGGADVPTAVGSTAPAVTTKAPIPLAPIASLPSRKGTAPSRAGPEGFVWIESGTFLMGSPASEEDRYSDEDQHAVTLTQGFWLSDHEVTQGEYQAVMGGNPSLFKGDPNRPVERVSWHDAVRYCRVLTERDRAAGRITELQAYRLPTEAEWEYAARAGLTESSNGDRDALAWHGGNSGDQTHPVKQKAANPWGLHDMLGNVWEWCEDRHGGYPTRSVADPIGPGSSSDRVRRGGSWFSVARYARPAHRGSDDPGARNHHVGFRPAFGPVR